MDEHAFPPTGFAVAWLGCSLQYFVQNLHCCNLTNVLIFSLLSQWKTLFSSSSSNFRNIKENSFILKEIHLNLILTYHERVILQYIQQEVSYQMGVKMSEMMRERNELENVFMKHYAPNW